MIDIKISYNIIVKVRLGISTFSFLVQKIKQIKKYNTAIAGKERKIMELSLEAKLEKVRGFRPIDDGLHEIFINTVIDDGTDIAELMSCFMKKEVKNSKFPALTAEMARLKETEGGVQAVCEVMKKYEDIAVKNERIQMLCRMIEKGYTKEDILELGYTSEEYAEAKSKLTVTV